MHFKVAKKQLLDGLNIVSRAVSLNSPLPSLHGILLVVKEDFIQMTASDLDISIQVKIVKNEDSHLEVAETGEIILDSKYILDALPTILKNYQEQGFGMIPAGEILLQGNTTIDVQGKQHPKTTTEPKPL